MRTLLASLNDHPMALLRGIAELRGIALTSNARDEVAAQLAAALAQPAATEAALMTCSPAGRSAWAALLAAGGRMKAAAFSRMHGSVRPVGPGRLEREQLWRQPATPAEELWYRGLIYRAFADQGDGPTEYYYIPSELQPVAAQQVAAAPTAPTLNLDPMPSPPVARQAANALAVDLCALLAVLRDAPLRVDPVRLRPAETARLTDSLLHSDPVRLDLLLALAQGLGWLAVHEGRLTVQPAALSGWLRATHWEQMTTLFTAWRDSTDPDPVRPTGVAWNDLRRIPALRAEGGWRNDPVLARRAILAALSRLPQQDGWYRLEDLIAAIKSTNPDFQRPDGNYALWYLRDVETGGYLSGFEAWDEVEGRLIRFLVAGPLFWLGAVALYWPEPVQPVGSEAQQQGQTPPYSGRRPLPPVLFRLTSYGHAWLTGGLPSELPQPARLIIGEDFIVRAPLALPLLDRFRLLRFTDPVHPLAVAPAGPTQHRITRGSLARARKADLRAQAISDFLQRTSGGRVPPRVVAALARWDQHGGQVRISHGAVLRVEDAAVLATLRSDPVLAPLLSDLISAQAVLVKEANLPRVLRTLEELGYSVKVEK